MALQSGDKTATSGMTKAIYDQMNAVLSPPLSALPPADLTKIRNSWKQLAFAISKGVIDHITANMEIKGVQTTGNISAAVSGNTATQTGVVFTQSNDGTGRVA
ncbi:MAG TPA: hypothetical protein PKD12_02220 [Nitrospira sp.]|nr:hypothetical protein [Nitrospira sp.]